MNFTHAWQLCSARLEGVMDRRVGPVHGCPYTQMFLALASDFAVKEGSKKGVRGTGAGGAGGTSGPGPDINT